MAVLRAPVAQGIERRFPKPCVARSIRVGSTTEKPAETLDLERLAGFCFAMENLRHASSVARLDGQACPVGDMK